ncbi:cell wall-active antibiotics response protein [Reichenbachiella agarivorans]|uniref:Cell wall-active antibiotics response protein n=1 Tax=Reichenbachiella agarivorans TaxID=2979464 RepID=A0ABY6CV58_9BACT|nr:cell wall-active antibiotics response protein [Reichenbachiella agarivorans]UXP33268.1 cell wall-active antibiotics response protein [Reichenbachiella agarivorans]
MNHSNRRASLGIIMIVIGILFLLDNFNIISFSVPHYLFTWQMILVVVGIFQFATGNQRGGVILISLGIIFWIPRYFNISFHDYWPVFLIAIGLSFFLKSRTGKIRQSNSDSIDHLAVLGGTNQNIDSKQFAGGRITTIFGGVELDLRHSNLENGQATIDSFTTFGSVRLFVPEDWVVNYEATTVFGGYKDKRAHKPTEYFGNVLTLKGLVLFGGVELMS